MPVGVIVVAAGRGVRMGAPGPKQFVDLDGRTMLRRSVDAFDRHPLVDALVVVLPADLVASADAIVGATERPCQAVAGGARRQDSVASGLRAMPDHVDVVLVHDAARPFVGAGVIARVIEGVASFDAVVPAVLARDTVKRVVSGQAISETLRRDEIWLAQTPQGFRREVLAEAVALGQGGVEATDEAMLVERAGRRVVVVEGEAGNVKITTPDDLQAARARLAAGAPRVGTGYDLHRLVDGRPLVLAGVQLLPDRGPLGHSDGDVVCHAVVDAMLGAAGAGDIGSHFPNTDPAWKNAAGLDLLGRAAAIVADRGWAVAGVDVTVLLERPKLAPHVTAIRAAMARVLGLGRDDVSVKGKTNEGVDAVGRGEAIAAHAVAVLVSRRGQ
jgi:2-C-methyl-D-erythritol 4-phosphate cytidylyltransferase / 2-C-methyl-D-erythritol 2,4-cyclodiphosphate synthase